MADIDLKTETPDGSLPTDGFLFGADSQSAAAPSVYTTQAVATTLLGSTSLTGATLTASSPVLNLSQTWNNAATTFTGLRFNATDTASASGSLLMDLQVGGASRFKVEKNGNIVLANSQISGVGIVFATFFVANSAIAIRTDAGFGLSFGAADDVRLTRRGPANLRLGAADAAAPVAQTLSVQSVVAGTSNTAGQPFTITGSQGTGNAAGGSIVFQVAPAGASGTAQNALVNALTIGSDQNATFTGSVIANTVGSSSGGTNILAFGSSRFAFGRIANTFELRSDGIIGWSAGTSIGGTLDLFLARDAANTLALRNGVNAQTARIYGSFTSASVYKRLALSSTTTVATVAAETDAGDMDLALTPAGAGNVRYGTHEAIGAETVTGFIEIKDAGGTIRKLAVVS
jgi:hypothetical protein